MIVLRDALRDLRANRVRALLSGLGIFLAVISIVAIVSASAIVKDVFVAQEEQENGRAVTVQSAIPLGTVGPAEYRRLEGALERRIADHGGAYAIESTFDGRLGDPRLLRSGGVLPETSLTAVGGRLDHVRRLPLVSGRWLRPGTELPPEVVLNQAGAERWGPVGSLVELQPTLGGPHYPARVAGIVADGADDPTVLLSIRTVLAADPSALDGRDPPTVLAHRRSTDQNGATAMVDAAASDLGVDPSQLDVTRSDHVAQLSGRLRATRDGFLAAGLVALVIAVVGLLNIGLASVRERSRELVIRRAIGATRGRVFSLVLLSAVFVALLATGIAIAVSLALVYGVVPALIRRDSAVVAPSFPWEAAVLGVGVGLSGAIAGAAYPAWVAARIDVALALRD